MEGRTRRPWLAALLAFIQPGLGHAYLREWLRALLWFGLAVGTAVAVIPESAVSGSAGLEGVLAVTRQLPLEATIVLFLVTALNTLDAYWLALRNNRRVDVEGTAGDATTCPNCGRELDENIDFCHWCTTRLDGSGE